MRTTILGWLGLCLVAPIWASDNTAPPYTPDLTTLTTSASKIMAPVVERFETDSRALGRRFDVGGSAIRRQGFRQFLAGWSEALDAMDFDALGVEDRADWLLLQNHIADYRRRFQQEEDRWQEAADLIPFAATILDLQTARRDFEPIDPPAIAATLDALEKQIATTHEVLVRGLQASSGKGSTMASDGNGKPSRTTTKTLAQRTVRIVSELRETLDRWFSYYDGYHPAFSWWARSPHAQVDAALEKYAKFLKEEIVGDKEGADPKIVGDPIGREALLAELELEMIAYSPEELLAIAREQYAWCERELLAAADELGFGDDWAAALERVKTLHVEPGGQPELVHRLAVEAIDFLEARDLLTIPPLAKDIWRMEMMSPERQKINPFFTGGEVISVSFPTDGMSHEEKAMSLRGNNIHFSRATVHHELIPGHHLQFFMNSRYERHRRTFRTPFWTEGWALYWEMRLWDLGFPQTAEDRIGMLFWRTHRAARILFSLSFHLGLMDAEEAIALLVDKVGHEPENAEAEVRRSFEDRYPPLYQAAYLLGGLQIRALHQQLVVEGDWSERSFHDAILEGGPMPIEMIRARLLGLDLDRDYRTSWRFAGDPEVEVAGE